MLILMMLHQLWHWWFMGRENHDIELDLIVFRIRDFPVAWLTVHGQCQCGKEWGRI